MMAMCQSPDAAQHSQTITLPTQCVTVRMRLVWNTVLGFSQTCYSSAHKTLFQNSWGSSMLFLANLSMSVPPRAQWFNVSSGSIHCAMDHSAFLIMKPWSLTLAETRDDFLQLDNKALTVVWWSPRHFFLFVFVIFCRLMQASTPFFVEVLRNLFSLLYYMHYFYNLHAVVNFKIVQFILGRVGPHQGCSFTRALKQLILIYPSIWLHYPGDKLSKDCKIDTI